MSTPLRASTAPLPTRSELEQLAEAFEQRSAESILAWAVQTYKPRLVVSCSFGGPTGMVIVDLLMKIDSSIPVAYLDTGLLFNETYNLVKTVAEKYGITPIAILPKQSVEEQNASCGNALWGKDPESCCARRKVEPQRAFLQDYDAWITGLRRDQSSTRKQTHVVQWDNTFSLVKINPLAMWDERAVWRYIEEHDVPYNPLLSSGYASLGCTPCTRPIFQGEDARAGRWSGFQKTECGLHVSLDSSQL